MNQNIVFYHGNCLDGTASAWVAMHYLPKDTIYLPAFYQAGMMKDMEMVKQCEGKNVWFLDWCPELDQLEKTCLAAKSVTIIDHHESAIKKLTNWISQEHRGIKLPKLFLAHENQWSGAIGTAIFFEDHLRFKLNGELALNYRLNQHWLVRAVDDRDRWQFKLPYTRQINEGLGTLTLDPSLWFAIVMDHAMEHKLVEIGQLLIDKTAQSVEQVIKACAFILDKIAVCNCPYFLASEVGNKLAQDSRIAIMYFFNKEGNIAVSLRSNKATKGWINCAVLAMAFGGGGHANAAGFSFNGSLSSLMHKLNETILLIPTCQSE